MNTNLENHFFTNAFTQNPYPTYSQLREGDPVYRMKFPDGQNGWMITRYEDGVEVLKDPRFIKDFTKLSGADIYSESVFARNMLFADPPDHKRLRSLVQKAFTPQMVVGLRGRIQEITDELLDNFSEKDSMNLIDDYAFQLPIIVICEMLGVPTEDRDKFRVWSNSLIEGSDGVTSDELIIHTNEFIQYLEQWFAKVRGNLGQDLISQLIISEDQGDQLTESELYGIVTLLIVAGHETTVNLIGNSILALLEHPEQLKQLQENPDLIHTAIEEVLRYNGPVEFSTSRWAGEDLEFKGKSIAKGDLVIIALNSANHDPNQFDDPEVFDITRQKSQHLAFGKGVHLCLGAPLARLEGEIAIMSLLKRYPHIQLKVDKNELEWRPGMIVRGVKEIPISL
ncbi:MAG TPA: cytochrome P450 [Paenibacillus sp.]|jgi:cytochrome P450